MTTRLRALALKLHLYLGLTAGLVIMVLCLSAASLVFEQEITRALYPERYAVQGAGKPVALHVVLDSARAAVPTGTLSGLLVSNDHARPWEVSGAEAGKVLIDPYTGHVIAVAPYRLPFFQKAMEIHRWLMADDLGEMITGAATVMFVVLLCMGLILWWPKTKGAFKARINPFMVFSKHGGGRRKLHDLHVALGIWCWPFLLFMALTGLPEAYDWGSKALYFFTMSPHAAPAPSSGGDSTMATIPLDSLMLLGWKTFPGARLWSARISARGNNALAVAAIPFEEPSERKSDVAYFDRHTGALLRVDRWADLPIGTRARRMIEPVHTGTGWGMVSKVMFFLATLFGASFPVTGFLMYRAGLRTQS